jgi:glycosyltransferase involved in cell wall biosynthesis
MKNNKISVIMSVYNSEKTIKKSVESIVNQNFNNFDLLIMDDASSDGTFRILQDLYKKYSLIKLYQNRVNLGLTKSLNILLGQTDATYIARQDSDDISVNSRLQKQFNYLKKNQVDALTTRAYIIGSNKKIPKYSYLLPNNLVMKYKNPFIHGTLLATKECIDKVGGYDEAFYYSQDYKLFSDLLNKNFKVKILNEILYGLNTKDNISSKFKEDQRYFANCVKKNLKPKMVLG